MRIDNARNIGHPLDNIGDEPPSYRFLLGLDELGDEPPSYRFLLGLDELGDEPHSHNIRHPLDEFGNEPHSPNIRHPLDEFGNEPPSYAFLLSSGVITLETNSEGDSFLAPPSPFHEGQYVPVPFNHQARPSLEREELKKFVQKTSRRLQTLFICLLIFFLCFALILSLVSIFTKHPIALNTAFGICGLAALASLIALPVIQKKCQIED